MTDMDGHFDIETLSGFADGDVSEAVAARVERHLRECASCRAAMARVGDLVSSARALPRGVEPPVEAWTGLRERLAREGTVALESRRRWWHSGWMAAAAALILVAGTALVARTIGGGTDAPLAAGREQAQSVSRVVLAVDGNYEPTLSDLRETLDGQRGRLAPHTVRVLEHSVAVIDSAIAEAREALAADPASVVLVEILAAQYERKVDLLQRATQLSPSI